MSKYASLDNVSTGIFIVYIKGDALWIGMPGYFQMNGAKGNLFESIQ